MREWRESVIPKHLRAKGVLRIEGKSDGRRFEWTVFGGERRGGSVRLLGEIIPTATGAVVKARVARYSTWWPPAAMTTGLGVLATIFSSSRSMALQLFVVGGLLALAAWAQDGTIPNWTASRADYLLARLDRAIANVEAMEVGSPQLDDRDRS